MWRHRRILGWVFTVNVALGVSGTVPAVKELKRALGHSLAGGQLFRGFDLEMFRELLRIADINVYRFPGISNLVGSLPALPVSSYTLAGIFAVFMLFVSGGIIETYLQGRRRISTGDFFAASGAFFWRFVRLALLSAILFAVLGNGYLGVEKVADYLGDKATADQTGFIIWLAGVILLVLLALFVRLWFDIARIHAVAHDERRMLRSAQTTFDIAVQQIGTLLWMYISISLVAGLTLLVAFLIWTRVPPTAIWVTFVLLEIVMLVQMGARLWQMASATVWYQRHQAASLSLADSTALWPEEVTAPDPQLPLYPETELPPAGA